jgi:D-alanyl-D-alanine carboxypeptidase
MDMLTAAHTDGITVWQVSAAYRTWQMQDDLFNAQVADYMRNNRLSETDAVSAARLTVADPGTSEHMTGLAFDITVPGKSFKGTEQANWIAANCWDYGFILRYEEDKQRITGFLAEPWHIRYVGKEHSIPIRDAGMCLEEYVQMRQGGAR